ncbi:MAG: glycosyltransferase family 2 protein [Candidatus Uhrbacteria bacterium]|nr:glycosyltransferase family 2 protein [Candidatus Uhrbacteria bacterium]
MNRENSIFFLPPRHSERVDLAIVTVSWNVKDHLIQNYEALLNSHGQITAEIILIDNDSKDGTRETIRERFPLVRVIANDRNAGFAAANMQGMLAAHARHCLLLNPDMRVEPDALQKTVEYLDAHADVAVVGGRLLSANGQIVKSVRRFPDVWSQLLIILKLPHLLPRVLDRYLYPDFDYAREQSVEVVRGSYFAIHERALEILGGLDTRYFIWFEEMDYCKQAIGRGFKVMYVPWICATDYVGRSFSQTKRFLSQRRFTKAMVQYFEKWHAGWQWRLLSLARYVGLCIAWLADQWLVRRGAKEYRSTKT